MNIGSRYHNFYLSGLWILETLTYVNSSLNIVVYYTIGSCYRDTFWMLFGRSKRNKAKEGKSVTTATTV